MAGIRRRRIGARSVTLDLASVTLLVRVGRPGGQRRDDQRGGNNDAINTTKVFHIKNAGHVMLCCPSLYSTYHTTHAVATRGKVHLPVAVQPVSTARTATTSRSTPRSVAPTPAHGQGDTSHTRCSPRGNCIAPTSTNATQRAIGRQGVFGVCLPHYRAHGKTPKQTP